MSLPIRLFAGLLLAACAHAQDTSTATVIGRLHGDGDMSIHGYVIELNNLATHQSVDRVEVSADGEFTARHVPYGEYLAKVTTYHGDTISQQFISVNQPTSPIELRLPERPQSPTGTTVSAKELRNPPRRKAIDASVAAQHFSESGKFDRAATELEKAIEISPDYAIAHSNLGTQYIRLGRYRDAESEILRAMEIAGTNTHDLGNLAFAQLAQEKFADATETARQVLKTQRDSPQAHYVLGLALVLEPETRGEGVAHLEEAAKQMEAARKALAAIHALKR